MTKSRKQTNALRFIPKEHRGAIKALVADGWKVTTTGSGHLRLTPPREVLDAKPDAPPFCSMPKTASDWRSWRNAMALIRREYGVEKE